MILTLNKVIIYKRMEKVRVRFAPSPTGPLHIGGVRTALYTYLIARKYNGTFILRIEDTDQARYVEGAEEYIIESLKWCGIIPDEGPGFGGDYGPYRQSERKEIYQKYAYQLISEGKAYYAFDTAEEIEAMRVRMANEGNMAPKYDHSSRLSMRNSLTLSENEAQELLEKGENVTIRLKVEPGEEIHINDLIRGEVVFKSDELDDKILLKGDGMPTYHMANIVDDHLMKISHVIRGEEWLSSTAHHVLLHRAMGWGDEMPEFAHLPLILKPDGKGKLSKRDGAKFGFPVFPISWDGGTAEDSVIGFREFGFDPKATLNFLAFLGWNPGTEQEIFTLEELSTHFNLDQIVKSGARFDIDKARWYNQQYIIQSEDEYIANQLSALYPEKYKGVPHEIFIKFISLMKERVEVYADFYEMGYYFFEDIKAYDDQTIKKKWKKERTAQIEALTSQLLQTSFDAVTLKATVEAFISNEGLNFGVVLPFLRIGLTGTMKGPDVFEMMSLLGKDIVKDRMEKAVNVFNDISDNS